MTRRRFSALFLVSALAAALAVPPHASADGDRESDRDEDDHDAARAAVRRGEALPLSDVIAAVSAELPGEIVEIEFESKRGRWIYEFKVLDRSGRLREIYVDAATAKIVTGWKD